MNDSVKIIRNEDEIIDEKISKLSKFFELLLKKTTIGLYGIIGSCIGYTIAFLPKTLNLPFDLSSLTNPLSILFACLGIIYGRGPKRLSLERKIEIEKIERKAQLEALEDKLALHSKVKIILYQELENLRDNAPEQTRQIIYDRINELNHNAGKLEAEITALPPPK